MKLKNKKTGVVGELASESSGGINRIVIYYPTKNGVAVNPQRRDEYGSLAELSEEWEDYKEPEKFWCVERYGGISSMDLDAIEHAGNLPVLERYREIGNYFETEDKAVQTVEELKAWKRLRAKGFRFTTWEDRFSLHKNIVGQVHFEITEGEMSEVIDDLNLLFGGPDGK